jgi:hypothetical protein
MRASACIVVGDATAHGPHGWSEQLVQRRNPDARAGVRLRMVGCGPVVDRFDCDVAFDLVELIAMEVELAQQ